MKVWILFFAFVCGFANAQKRLQPDSEELTWLIHEKIVEISPKVEASEMKPYIAEIRQTRVKFDMVPVPGGVFVQGSPETEEERGEDEGPQRTVAIEPFWMGKFEVTWDEFEPFMMTNDARSRDGSRQQWSEDDPLEDLVAAPTSPYTDMSFGMGLIGYPAGSMTQHSALKYCQWISAQTGQYYRLPTEAEWEYACRAGTNTRYSWGDDPKMADQYAWFYDNADDKYQRVGQKLPNPWGLHDMHGNMLEWTLDFYYKDAYERNESYEKPVSGDLYPRSIRGGSWYDDVKDLRSARRFKSHYSWKREDPQSPKSIWYHVDAQWLGFRVVRPFKIPDAKTMHEIWNSGRGKENKQP